VKVLVCTAMWPSPERPAFGSFVREQFEDLERAGIDVELLYIRGGENRFNYGRGAIELRSRVRRRSYDLVHAHYGLVGAVALAQQRVPAITTFHGSETGYVPWQTKVSWVVARLTEPIFVSADAAVRLGLPEARVIPVGVDLEVFRPRDRAEVRAELGWNQDARYVLLPGPRGNRRKGAPLFDAVVAGLREAGADVRAVSLDNLPRRQAALVMAGADVMLMTSEFEGAPMAVKEALACLTPVVSVPVGDVPHVLDGLPLCATPGREVGGLVQAVLTAFDGRPDPALRERAEQYSREAMAARVIGVYEELANAPGAVRPRGGSKQGTAADVRSRT
jgi:teichuronic acid biosynthesis glycosyltransferase TuaC